MIYTCHLQATDESKPYSATIKALFPREQGESMRQQLRNVPLGNITSEKAAL